MRTDDRAWFRSLHYGFVDPNATICLWWEVLRDHRLHVHAELRHQAKTIEALATAIQRQTEAMRIDYVTYTVADQENIGKEDGDGETRPETFAKCGVPLRVIKPDPIQGWTRVRELLGLRPDGKPWLTIDPSCQYLIRALTSAMQDKSDSEDVMPFANDQPLKALRVGAMSRPAPNLAKPPELPKHAVGHLVNQLREGEKSSGMIHWR